MVRRGSTVRVRQEGLAQPSRLQPLARPRAEREKRRLGHPGSLLRRSGSRPRRMGDRSDATSQTMCQRSVICSHARDEMIYLPRISDADRPARRAVLRTGGVVGGGGRRARCRLRRGQRQPTHAPLRRSVGSERRHWERVARPREASLPRAPRTLGVPEERGCSQALRTARFQLIRLTDGAGNMEQEPDAGEAREGVESEAP